MSRQPARHGRGGFCCAELPSCPRSRPVHRPPGVRSGAEVRRGWTRRRPSASRRRTVPVPRAPARDLVPPLTPWCVPGQARGPRAARAGDGGRPPSRAAPWRPETVLGRGELGCPLCKPCHDGKTAVGEGRWGPQGPDRGGGRSLAGAIALPGPADVGAGAQRPARRHDLHRPALQRRLRQLGRRTSCGAMTGRS